MSFCTLHTVFGIHPLSGAGFSGIYWQFDVKCDSNVGPLVSDTDISAGTARGNDKHLFLSSY